MKKKRVHPSKTISIYLSVYVAVYLPIHPSIYVIDNKYMHSALSFLTNPSCECAHASGLYF